ncbi:EscR/YscR/HrcR family type III secretion system export apparatus protein [Bordetella genomosp. 9]|nr:EscR/YscR/HrcR family type III secretion system export apparatus protein [Bordetella genomosp. 9]
MSLSDIDPITVMAVMAAVALLPIAVVMTTSFLKISVVLALLRNAIGVQQVPPNMALNGLALILSAYVMAPVLGQVADAIREPETPVAQGSHDALPDDAVEAGSGGSSEGGGGSSAPPPVSRYAPSGASTPDGPGAASGKLDRMLDAVQRGAAPMRAFMMKFSKPAHRQFFVDTAASLWGEGAVRGLQEDNFFVLVPAFVLSQLNSAFQVGFLLYLPFIIIDLIVSNVLLAMGMMMVSPVTIAIPLKLFLFVMLDGWTLLIKGLVLSYS